ncbi:hypothetical protein FAIPA1_170004 [Frankia sp. AiPs1]|uniref:hypothetical protein n=1 Tax=Frankia sp. AiPa1 TaxID=573492 RepID=UPI00202B2E69|nr:hypothetical protein [Frankia sp. AiPa1]MCL9761681.1 hypothetical protein [Frankia sp. AiPa1]
MDPSTSFEGFLRTTRMQPDDPRRPLLARLVVNCLKEDMPEVADAIRARFTPEETPLPAESPPDDETRATGIEEAPGSEGPSDRDDADDDRPV